MNIQYDLSAAAVLKILGYERPKGQERLEQLKREKQIPLPAVYTEFMELAWQCPLFATSSLWTGKAQPRMYYDEIQEHADDLKAHMDSAPAYLKNRYAPFVKLPREEWTDKLEDYLIIGSDFGGGEATFGIRKEDLDQNDPPMYWRHERDPLAKWREDKQSLSGFLLEVLWNVLNGSNYDTAELELEKAGWRVEKYFDPKKEDWVASKTVLKKQGILYSNLKRYKCDEGGKVFSCYDKDLNVIYVGSLEEGEISLCAINRVEAEKVLLDIDDYDFPKEDA